MTLAELKDKLDLKALNDLHDKEISGVFISDMVSDIMAAAGAGELWITTQTHKNIVAAANLVDIAGIIVTRGKPVSEETLELAERAELTILTTKLKTYDLVGKLRNAGL